jgi:hypothetical protein
VVDRFNRGDVPALNVVVQGVLPGDVHLVRHQRFFPLLFNLLLHPLFLFLLNCILNVTLDVHLVEFILHSPAVVLPFLKVWYLPQQVNLVGLSIVQFAPQQLLSQLQIHQIFLLKVTALGL